MPKNASQTGNGRAKDKMVKVQAKIKKIKETESMAEDKNKSPAHGPVESPANNVKLTARQAAQQPKTARQAAQQPKTARQAAQQPKTAQPNADGVFTTIQRCFRELNEIDNTELHIPDDLSDEQLMMMIRMPDQTSTISLFEKQIQIPDLKLFAKLGDLKKMRDMDTHYEGLPVSFTTEQQALEEQASNKYIIASQHVEGILNLWISYAMAVIKLDEFITVQDTNYTQSIVETLHDLYRKFASEISLKSVFDTKQSIFMPNVQIKETPVDEEHLVSVVNDDDGENGVEQVHSSSKTLFPGISEASDQICDDAKEKSIQLELLVKIRQHLVEKLFYLVKQEVNGVVVESVDEELTQYLESNLSLLNWYDYESIDLPGIETLRHSKTVELSGIEVGIQLGAFRM